MPSPWKHPNTGVYYLRQRVPAELVAKARGKVIRLTVAGHPCPVTIGAAAKVSLRTKDAQEAKTRFREADKALAEAWASLREGPKPLTNKQIYGLVGRAYDAFTSTFDEEPHGAALWEGVLLMNARADMGDLNGLRIGKASSKVRAKAMEERFGGIADAVLLHAQVNTDALSRWRIVEGLKEALDQAALRNIEKAKGNYEADAYAARFPAFVPTADTPQPATITISGLFEAWRVDRVRKGGAASSAKRWAPVIASFIQFLSHDDASRVTRADVIRWRDSLLAKGAVAVDTFTKVNRAALRTIFGKAVDDGKLTVNPVEGVRGEKAKKLKERPKGFTKEEATTILNAALAAPTAGGETSNLTRMTRRWVPWLCAYTGARVAEMTQLRKQDFVTVEGVSCVRITPEAGAVKMGVARTIPLHSDLIAQGLLSFVSGAPDGPLFYNAKLRSPAPWDAPAKALAKWVREIGVKDRRVAPNHGWRHTFKTIADEADIPPKFSDAICGHGVRAVGDGYGDRTVKTLQREIEKLPHFLE